MCWFCDRLKQGKAFEWYYRTSSTNQNICEYVNGEDCSCCDKCDSKFIIKGISPKNSKDLCVRLGFYYNVTDKHKQDVTIDCMSECAEFSYCPMCGKKFSDVNDELQYPFEELEGEC